MNCLVVYTHPNPQSFNHAILETLTSRLKAQGHEVRVRDLYALKFDPVLTGADLAALQSGRIPADIQAEQEHIRWAEVVFFIAPIWWSSVPALARGYFDRILTLGFAYSFGPQGPKGLLTGKKAFLISTTGASQEDYSKSGMFKSMMQAIDQGVFEFCGFKVLGHQFFSSVTTCPPQQRIAMLEEVKAIADQATGR